MVKVAVITGSNKGIGLAIVKDFRKKFGGVVYLTSRDEGRGRAAVTELNKLVLELEYHQLDVSVRESVIKLRDHIKEKYGGIDILVNNAGIAVTALWSYSFEECKEVIDINYYSILTIHELLHPIVRNNGRILNISSSAGHLSNVKNYYWRQRLSRKHLTVDDINEFVNWFLQGIKNKTFNNNDIADEGTLACYRVSKIALTAVTMIQQNELDERNISINSFHPGLVKTDMTYGLGFYSADQAAVTPLYLVLKAPDTLKGSFVWYDRKVIDWQDYNKNYFFKYKSLLTSHLI